MRILERLNTQWRDERMSNTKRRVKHSLALSTRREAARASCFLYTIQAEIDALIEALEQSIAKRSEAVHQ